jgi:hypothetical protein
MRAIIAVATALVALAVGAVAHADVDPRRRVAVLEYRAGSKAMPELDDRFAKILAAGTSLDVVDAVEARKRYGSGLDAAVVACGGEAACVAKLGNRIGAQEILLVGISELGDVILTLQRIDVKKRAVSERIAEALAIDAAPDDAALRRYLERVMPKTDFIRYGVIHIDANLAGATVEVGGERRGTTPVPALRLRAPASYDIRVRKDGYVPFRANVAVPPEGEVRVEAELSRRASNPRWYQRWWVPVVAGVVVAGAAAGTYVLLSEDPDSVPVGGQLPR